jgi:carboxypeptidase family protein
MMSCPSWTSRAMILLALMAAARPAAAQSARAAPPTDAVPHLRGRVTDKLSHAAIPGAQVILDADGRFVTADSAGTYDFAGIPRGVVDLSVRAPAFGVAHLTLQLIGTGGWTQDVELDSASTAEHPVRLATVPVTAKSRPDNYRLQDFEIRRRSGRGQYLTDEEIRASGAANVADAARNMRGVTLDCGGTLYGGCRIRMLSAPARCLPVYWVDGQLDNEFGPLTPIRDVVAMELYTGPAEVPGEFAGSNAGCGVVALWTRSGPDRKRPKGP